MAESTVAIDTTAAPAANAATEDATAPDAARLQFAKELHAEFEGEETDEPEGESATPAAAAAKPRIDAPAKQVDSALVLDLLRRGDFDKLAVELGADKKAFRVGKNQFAAFKHQTAKARRELQAERATLETAKRELQQTTDQVKGSQATLIKAAEHLHNRDWVSFIETASGMSFDDVQKEIVQSALDPSSREVRRMRADQEARDRKDREREQEAMTQRQRHDQQQAVNRHMVELGEELIADAELNLKEFEKHPKFPVLVSAVFEQQKKFWDGESTISAKAAFKKAMRLLEDEAAAWQPYLVRSTNGNGTVTKSDPSVRGTRNPATRSVARSQGGPTTERRELSAQERTAMFARELAQELATT